VCLWRHRRLHRAEADKLFGSGRQTANEIVTKLQMQKSDIRGQFYEKKKSVDEICSFNDMDAEKGGRKLPGVEHKAAGNISRKVEENGPIVRTHFYTKRKSVDEICTNLRKQKSAGYHHIGQPILFIETSDRRTSNTSHLHLEP
jgi:hypothetical protein